MREETILYENLYQSILTQLYSGVLQYGQSFPSQRELCRQYNVGITTVRRVIRMLEENGFIQSSPGRRAVVCLRENDGTYAAALLQRQESIQDVYRGLELLMSPLYAQGALCCAQPAGLRAIWEPIGPGMERMEIHRRMEAYFTALAAPLQNPVLLDRTWTWGIMPACPMGP